MTSIYTSDGPVVICDKEGPDGRRWYTWYDDVDTDFGEMVRREREALLRFFRNERWWEPVPPADMTPKQELLCRLNKRLSGIDPGKPRNWRGVEDA